MVTYAQAQELAEDWINGGVPRSLQREVRVREFDLGFVCWAVDPADGPSSDGGEVRLVIARDSGASTLWPALPVNEVVRQYEEVYGRPVVANPAGAARPAPGPVEATSFLLSPPQWLQEAGAAAIAAEAERLGTAPADPAPAPVRAPAAVPAPAPAPAPVPTPAPAAAVLTTPPLSDRPAGDAPTMLAPPPPREGADAGAPAASLPQEPPAAVPAAGPAPAPRAGAEAATVLLPEGGYGMGPGAAAPPSAPPAQGPADGYAATMLAPPGGLPGLEGLPGAPAGSPAGPPSAAQGPADGYAPTMLAPPGGLPGLAGLPGAPGAAGGPGAAQPPGGPTVEHAPTMLAPPGGLPGLDGLPGAPAAPAPAGPPGGGALGRSGASAPPPPPPAGLRGGAAAPAGQAGAGRGPSAPPPPPPGGLRNAPGAGPAGSAGGRSSGSTPPPPPPAGLRGAGEQGVGPAAGAGADPAAAPGGPQAPAAGVAHQATQLAHAVDLPGGPGGPGMPAGGPAAGYGYPGAGAPGTPAPAMAPAAPPAPVPGPPQAAPVPPGVPVVGPGYFAALSYRAPDGSEQKLLQRSEPGTPHPEWKILHELRRLNVPPEQVLELYTELESCDLPGGYCARMIRASWPNVRLTHSADYGRDHHARQAGMAHLLDHLDELHQLASAPQRSRPVRVPPPPPGSVPPAAPPAPQQLAAELGQAFGPAVFRFEQRAVSRQGVPEPVAQTLMWAGLPREFGPFFWAQAQEGRPIPTLAELAAERGLPAGPDFGGYLVLGNDYGRQLCVQYGTAAVVAVDMEGTGEPPRFVNTGVPEFVRSLALLGRMWHLRFGLTQEQAARWTTDFQNQLVAIDPAALQTPDTWWAVLLEQFWDGLL
ncbi:SUKH-4 family immunity protein [Kitasatospora sp. NPDC050543]|uniref:SUKH-4 family immunity protein n=1 Tax=Kitasatospora sp. NPDC050543 TaxID=3364054 RepID=UPI00378C14F5